MVTTGPGDKSRIEWRQSVLLAGLATLVALLVSGCGPPDPQSGQVTEARAAQLVRMGDALAEVASDLGGQVLGESIVDECYEGQRNWKVDTGYDYRCSLLVGAMVGLDGNFRAQMLELDVSLEKVGWKSTDGEWPGQLVDRYWDFRAGESRGGNVRLDRLPGPNGVMRDDLRLLFDYGSDADDLERIDRAQQRTLWCCGLPTFESRDLMDVHRAAASAPQDQFILITLEGHYFQKR